MSQEEARLKVVGELFHKYREYLINLAVYIVKDYDDAQDIVQNLFFELIQNNDIPLNHESPAKFLGYRCKLRCFNFLRDNNRYYEKIDNLGLISPKEERTDFTESFQIRDNIFKAIDQLPHQRQRVFCLLQLEEKKYHTVATEMGIGLQSVKTHYKKALQQLRQLLNIHR